jgi:hypothetical protein
MSKIEVNQISSQCGSTLTIGQSGDTVTLACGATQSGFGRTGTVDWCTTAKTAPFTGVSGNGYFVNTTCGAVTVTLPATPTAGDIISIKDYARTAATNNINFCRNGSKMDGSCSNGSINTNGDSTTLIYVDGTKGWTSILDNTTNQYGAAYITATGGTISCSPCGDYKIHTFTSDGTFCVSAVGNPAGSNSVDYLVVAGGGSGAGGDNGVRGGGGGAGGYRESHCATVSGCYTASPLATPTSLPVSVQAYTITVGAGAPAPGPAVPINSPSGKGTSGSNSSFSTIISTGGGGGTTLSAGTAGTGGSGGGGGSSCCAPQKAGAAGNTPPVSPAQGFPGGCGTNYNGAPLSSAGGGGGGATAVGGNGNCAPGAGIGGDGGAGATTSISASSTAYAGGGGGGSCTTTSSGCGGAGGGGRGGRSCGSSGNDAGVAGTVNTGGGGGGGSARMNPAPSNPNVPGAAGGSGIVIIRYKFQN